MTTKELADFTKKGLSSQPSTIAPGRVIPPTDLDQMPTVSLPGFTPFAAEESNSLVRRLSDSFKKSTTSLASPTDPESGVRRKKSLTRPERDRRRSRRDLLNAGGITPSPLGANSITPSNTNKPAPTDRKPKKWSVWRIFSRVITFYAPDTFLRRCGGMHSPDIRQAWREKVALVSIVFFLCLLLGFITFGFQYVTCGITSDRDPRISVRETGSSFVNIRGDLYNIAKYQHPGNRVQLDLVGGKDVSWLFPLHSELLPGGVSACDLVPDSKPVKISCTVDGVDLRGHCHTAQEYKQMTRDVKREALQSYDWNDIRKGNKFMVLNGWVVNLDRYFKEGNQFLGGDDFDQLLVSHLGRDATMAFVRTKKLQNKMNCLIERFRVGVMENETPSCIASQVNHYISSFSSFDVSCLME
jgi:chitin synthase